MMLDSIDLISLTLDPIPEHLNLPYLNQLIFIDLPRDTCFALCDLLLRYIFCYTLPLISFYCINTLEFHLPTKDSVAISTRSDVNVQWHFWQVGKF